ncbi:MAG: alkaline phosphatase family protein, partial [Chloroflexota bacterium]
MANSTFHASRFTNPLVIAGLDGATWGVLDPLLAAGRLPTLGRLIERGSKTTLRSTWPPISAAAWITVITGLNPGRHGVFDFRNLDLGSYTSHNEELATVGSYSVPTLFDYLGWAGRAAIAYQVPLTYP